MIHYFLNQFFPPTAAKGTIINGASRFAASVVPGVSSYGVSKIANMRLTEYLDAEHAGIRAFSSNPGIVNTDMMKGDYEVFAKDTRKYCSMKDGKIRN
jgi:NAD(P)-dependent dehydrogenase (short-subunit alcohol dehydrogenase family)